MSYAASRSVYQSQAVETAGPAQLVLMMYDGALAALTRARQADANGAPDRLQVVHKELVKVQDIVTELLVTLDTGRGGQVARGLASLYQFCLDRLVQANMRKDLSGLDAVASTLADLREAWNQACVQGVTV